MCLYCWIQSRQGERYNFVEFVIYFQILNYAFVQLDLRLTYKIQTENRTEK